MFITLKYVWSNYWKTVKRGRPNKRAFFIFLRMLGVELKCLFMLGHSIDELT
jgi:hypothetical protein